MHFYLAHACNLKASDLFVDIKVAPLDDENVCWTQHFGKPFRLDLDFFLGCLLDDNKAKGEVACKTGDGAAVAFALKLSKQRILLHPEEHPEAGEVSFESGEVLLVDRWQGWLIHQINDIQINLRAHLNLTL